MTKGFHSMTVFSFNHTRAPLGEEGGLNLYAIVRNDPVNKWDMLGMASYDGRSKSEKYFYEFTVKKCEVAIIYGHGHSELPHEIVFEDASISAGYFWGCYPDVTNDGIPVGNRLVEDIGPHETYTDDEVFEKLKELHEQAKNKAKEICKTDCCKDGVWIRYQFSPHDTLSGRLRDWLKSYSSHRKPKDLVGGGKWEGDTHVPCEKSK